MGNDLRPAKVGSLRVSWKAHNIGISTIIDMTTSMHQKLEPTRSYIRENTNNHTIQHIQDFQRTQSNFHDDDDDDDDDADVSQ